MKKGFSLFELLVSISIIGILVALVSVSFSSAQRKARDAKRIQDLSSLQKATEQYYSTHNSSYPMNLYNAASMPWADQSGNPILSQWPTDPKDGQTSYDTLYTTYTYRVGGGGTTTNYCFYALLEEQGTGNCYANCDFSVGAVKNFYCVANQQ